MRIVVGVDGSSAAMAGARWVSHLPLGAEDEIVFVAAVQRPVTHKAWGHVRTPATEAASKKLWDQTQEAARAALAEAASTIKGLPCASRQVIEDGHPIDVLRRVAVETGADLLVIGPRGKGRLARLLLGSVSHGLLESLPVPVVVARRADAPPLRVLLATDGSSHSLAAARYLARMPLPASVQFHVLAVDDRSALPSIEDERSWASRAVDDAVAALAPTGRAAQPSIEPGYAQRRILTVADQLECDLIVTGARGLGGFSGLVLGSTSRAVSSAARCSVLVVGDRSSSDSRA